MNGALIFMAEVDEAVGTPARTLPVCRHLALTLLCVLVEFRHNGLLTNACTTLG
jgi:hypothetical protein